MERSPLENHLFYPRDIEGKKNEEYLETLRAINDLLMSRDTYLGICPSGSEVKGYADATSDFDYVVFGKVGINNEEKEIQKLTKDKFEKKHKIHVITLDLDTIDGDENVFAAETALLARPIIGKMEEIEKYRHSVKIRFGQLSEEERTAFINKATEEGMYRYDMHYNDSSDRLGLDVEQKDQLVAARRRLWEKRIQHFLSN